MAFVPAPSGSARDPGSPALPGPSELIASAVTNRTGRGIAAAVAGLIRSERLACGTRLPSIRALAMSLHVSATTVSEAWQMLGSQGMIRTSGRNGTVVLRTREVPFGTKSRRALWMSGVYGTDLSSGTPDSALLPSLRQALEVVATRAGVSNYNEEPTLPELADVIRRRWAGVVDPEDLMITDGAFDAVDRILRERLRAGDRVLVEQPTLPSLLDAIEGHGAVAVPVAMDGEGVRPEALRTALRSRSVMLITQPRAQNPTGISTTPRRMAEIAQIVADTSILVVEDDHTGEVASASRVSLAGWIPEQVVYIESFSKAYGPDLRLAAVGGPASVLRPIASRRRLGPVWSSRILQSLLLQLLRTEDTQESVARARATYRQRRRALQEAVEERGLATTGTEGLNLWVRVPHENRTLQILAERDIGAAPGSPFFVGTPTGPFLRVTCAALDVTRAGEVAELIAAAGR